MEKNSLSEALHCGTTTPDTHCRTKKYLFDWLCADYSRYNGLSSCSLLYLLSKESVGEEEREYDCLHYGQLLCVYSSLLSTVLPIEVWILWLPCKCCFHNVCVEWKRWWCLHRRGSDICIYKTFYSSFCVCVCVCVCVCFYLWFYSGFFRAWGKPFLSFRTVPHVYIPSLSKSSKSCTPVK